MSRKIIGIFVVTLLIATTFSVVGMSENNKTNEKSRTYQVNCERMTSVFKDGNGDELDQQQTEDCGYGRSLYSSRRLAQGFQPSLEVLTRVKLHIFKHGDLPEGVKITVSIRASLDEEDLTNVSKDVSHISYPIWEDFDFPDLDVITGVTYYIVCRASMGNNDNSYCWHYDINDPYKNGDAWISNNNGIDWSIDNTTNYPQKDFCFKTYGRGSNPYKPDTPNGPEIGEVGEEYAYTTNAIDPLDKQLSYMWDWGDGNYSEWFGPYSSGATVSSAHSWSAEGIYSIKVKAKNTDEFESEWSNPIIVGIPKKNDGIDQRQDETGGTGYGIYPGKMLAQSFVPFKNTLTKVGLYMWKVGNPETITVSIRDDLDGEDLTFVEKSADSIPEKKSWIEFDFPDIEIIPGQMYYIVWDAEIPNLDNNFYWAFGDDDPYEQGNAWYGLPWEEINEIDHPHPDFCFRTFYAKSKIKECLDSIWPDPFSVIMPKSKAINTPFLQFLENHPYLFPLLRQLLGL